MSAFVTRVRTGIMRDDDGWWVVQQIGNERRVYSMAEGVAFPDQAQADMAAQAAARATREALAARGVTMVDA